MITRHFGIPVTSPGAILRRERDLGTPLGLETAEVPRSMADLVPDKIIVDLIEDWLRLHGGHGFVFDGFPRTLPQAESLKTILTKSADAARPGDLAGGLRGNCARSHHRAGLQCGGVVSRPVRASAQFAEPPDLPVLRWPIGAPQR